MQDITDPHHHPGKYFPSDCSEIWPTVIIDSYGGDIRMDTFDANIGNGIGKVLCRYSWAARDRGAGPNTTFIDDKGVSVLTKRDDNSLMTLAPGTILFTSGAGVPWATNAEYQCRTLAPQVYKNVRKISQAKGTICKYFWEDCSEVWPRFILDSRAGDICNHPIQGPRDVVAQVLCGSSWTARELGAGPDTIVVVGNKLVAGPSGINALPPEISRYPVRRLEAVSPTSAVAAAFNDRGTSHWTPLEDSKDSSDYELIVCHAPNFLGKCFTLTGQGCYPVRNVHVRSACETNTDFVHVPLESVQR